tara:strand:+ start:1777 stop:2229 length:453 start_codon:yes stop_codon:yes gene_type:complete
MDISNNIIDLQYLTNPSFSNIIEKKMGTQKNKDDIDTNMIQLYRRRILLLTKDMLLGKKSKDVNLDDFFLKYCDYCVKYFKLEDNVNIIQKDYVKYNKKNNKSDNRLKQDFKMNNDILFKEKKKEINLSKFIIKKSNKKNTIIPQIKSLN